MPPHVGRGGWSWYTGSAGWFYRLIVESLLGLRRDGDRLYIEPCAPEEWSSFSMSYRFGDTVYRITASRAFGTGESLPATIVLDGVTQTERGIPLVDDGEMHRVDFCLH